MKTKQRFLNMLDQTNDFELSQPLFA